MSQEGKSEAKATEKSEMKTSEVLQGLRSQASRASDEWQSTLKRKILNFMVFLFSVPCLFVFVIGSYDVFRNVEENKCQMTFMWEYPQYVKIPMEPAIAHKFPMYGLYAYAEGKHIEPVRNLKFSGIPVLYLPGNAGSYKQVRSFASVALRKWLDNRTPFHFDFFSVDFNEELSGLYGYVLARQSDFLKRVVERITALYEDYHQIVIIGHSMGGILAKSINMEETPSVQLIYSMATPHLHPPLIADPELELFYYYTTYNWTRFSKTEDSSPVTLISVAGGERDLLVSERLTSWKHNTIHTSAPAIPTVWASTDHLCIVWCKQLVMTLVRSLFDLVEYKPKLKYYGITPNATVRETVLNYHFVQRSSGKSFHSAHQEIKADKPPRGNWTEILRRSFCEASFQAPTYVMIPQITFHEKMAGLSRDYEVLVATTNTNPKDWIFGCTDLGVEHNIKYCSAMENLSNATVLLPSFHRNRKVIHLKADLISKYSHIIVKMGPAKFKTCLDVEVYKVSNRTTYLGTVIKDTQNAMFYNLTYPVTFNQSKLFAWDLHVEPLREANGNVMKCPGHHNSVGIFKHGDFQTHNFFKNESLRVRFADTSARSGFALLYLAKGCRYSIRVSIDLLGTAGQLFRVGGKLIPAYFASIVLMSLFFQKSTKDWINFHRLLLGNAYGLAIVPGFIVALSIACLPTDYRYMLTDAEYSAILPMLCYFVAYACVLLVSLGLWVLTLTFGNGLHGIMTRFITKRLGSVPEKVTDLALDWTMERAPFTVSVFVIALAMSTSGALGLGVGFVLHILKIFKGYEDILEDLIRGKIKDVGEGLSPINFQMHAALLWLIAAVINLPSLVYWINSFKFVEIPNWDLSLYLCLMLAPTLAFLWQGYVPNFNPTMWWIQRYLCYFMGIVVAVYGTHRIYLISLIIVLVLVSLAICQFISSLAGPEEEAGSDDAGIKSLFEANSKVTENGKSALSSSSSSESEEKSEKEPIRSKKEDLEGPISTATEESSDSDLN